MNQQLVLPIEDFPRAWGPGDPACKQGLLQPQPADGRASRGSASTWTTRWRSTTSRRWTSCPSGHDREAGRRAATRSSSAASRTRRDFPVRGLLIDKRFGHVLKMDRYKFVDEGLPRLPRALERGAARALPLEEDSPGDAALPLDRHALRAQRGGALRRAHRGDGEGGLRRSTTRASSPTSARASTRRTATAPSSTRSPATSPRFVTTRSRARADAPQAPQRRQEALPADELALVVHRQDDDYLLGGAMTEYPTWRNYFDVVIVAATKPAFFQERRPLLERDGENGRTRRASRSSAARSTRAATCTTSSAPSASTGDEVLYVGDHIYGDILRSKKESAWRTAMIIQELEVEVAAYESCKADFARTEELEEAREQPRGRSPLSTRRASRTCRASSSTRRTKPNGVPLAELDGRARARQARRRAGARQAAARRTREIADIERRVRPALPPVLGLAPQGGERAVELRRAGRGVRLPVHLARVELPLVLAPAVLPKPSRRHGARDRRLTNRGPRLTYAPSAGIVVSPPRVTARRDQAEARGLRRRGAPALRARGDRASTSTSASPSASSRPTRSSAPSPARRGRARRVTSACAGLKDKVGVTTQTISLPIPPGRAHATPAYEERVRILAIDGVTIHDVRRAREQAPHGAPRREPLRDRRARRRDGARRRGRDSLRARRARRGARTRSDRSASDARGQRASAHAAGSAASGAGRATGGRDASSGRRSSRRIFNDVLAAPRRGRNVDDAAAGGPPAEGGLRWALPLRRRSGGRGAGGARRSVSYRAPSLGMKMRAPEGRTG